MWRRGVAGGSYPDPQLRIAGISVDVKVGVHVVAVRMKKNIAIDIAVVRNPVVVVLLAADGCRRGAVKYPIREAETHAFAKISVDSAHTTEFEKACGCDSGESGR